jgi:transcriptional regulator with XRE-family HTH domain
MTSDADLVALSRVRRLTKSGAARTIRLSAGLSLAELGARAGVGPSTVFRWERGQRSPHGEAALRYGATLDALHKADVS